jgi:Tfp pilus assembly protein PilX
MKNNKGAVLFLTLIFLFVLTLLAVDGSQNIILMDQMQNAMQNNGAVFAQAELGMRQAIFSMEGDPITLPESSITVTTNVKIIKIDDCDNQTVRIRSTASDSATTIVLNSLDIFAKVPKESGCKKIPEHHIVWWRES